MFDFVDKMVSLGMLMLLVAAAYVATGDCCSALDRQKIHEFWDHTWSGVFTRRRIEIMKATILE